MVLPKPLRSKVPLRAKYKLERIHEFSQITKTEIMTLLIQAACAKLTKTAEGENAKMSQFIDAYILKHYGKDPKDPEAAQSEALAAYYDQEGYQFGNDEDSFILPKLDN